VNLVQVNITRKYKYAVVGDLLSTLPNGMSVIDVGARDRILKKYLPDNLKYFSADVIPGHDFLWNLELPLSVEDNSFDSVVCLDVLEHLENIHSAFLELLRIAKYKLFITLPNMSCFSFRYTYLMTGRLSGKYDLLTEHQGDRHRWLTGYNQSCHFVNYLAIRQGAQVDQWNIVSGGDYLQKMVSHLPLPHALRTYTILYEITKKSIK